MSAQAKPSLSFDSPQTPDGGCGSHFEAQSCACGGTAGGAEGSASSASPVAAAGQGSGAEVADAAAVAAACLGGYSASGIPAATAGIADAGAAGALVDGGVATQLPLGLYVHVPFCSSTCDFCAFYQEKPLKRHIDLYLEAVAAELEQVRAELRRGTQWLWQGELGYGGNASAVRGGRGVSTAGCGHGVSVAGGGHGASVDVSGEGYSAGIGDASSPVAGSGFSCGGAAGGKGEERPLGGQSFVSGADVQDGAARYAFTVFFGGGTPGLLPVAELGLLCSLVRSALEEFGDIVEWSIELAPATVRADRVKVLLEHGVNRFSLGVQSFSDELLEGLGRQHSRKQIFAAFETLRAAGAKNINCDLMFALPGQTPEAWLTDLQTLADLGPEHISTYCLTFEEDTAMWVKLSQGRYKLDPEREADLYRETWAWLANAGYAQYEVSNFARAGYHSRHNIGTWSMGRWRGVGPSAASQWGGWRFQNPANLEGWAGAVLATARRAGDAVSQAEAGLGTVPPVVAASPVLPQLPSDEPLAPVQSSCAPVPPPASERALPASPLEMSERTFPLGVKLPQLPPDEPLAPVQSSCAPVPPPASERALPASPSGNVLRTFPLGVKLPQLPPVQSEERVELSNRLLAADALIFGLRRRDGVNRAQWLARFAGAESGEVADGALIASTALPLAAVEALFNRFYKEGLLDTDALAAGVWRLNDEGLLLSDAVGGQLLECFEDA